MNVEHVEEELLQRYFDGELESERAREIALHLETCSGCMGRHTALGRLHRLLALEAVEHAQSLDSEALFARVERAARERPEPSAAERAAMRREDAPARTLPQRIWVPLGAGLAAAAALLVFLQQAPTEELPATVEGAATRLSVASSEVEQVDFGSKAGTVFDVDLADDVSTPVVWIDDDDDDDEK